MKTSSLPEPLPTPQLTLERLKAAGMDLCRFIDKSPALTESERHELFATIGEISYISDGIELALAAQVSPEDASMSKLTQNANRLADLVKQFT